jgi:hypothetical protein
MKRIEELYDKYLRGVASDAEKQELFAEFKTADDADLTKLASKYLSEKAPEDLRELTEETDLLFNQIKQRIDENQKPAIYRLWPQLVAAVAVLLAVTTGILFYINKQKPVIENEVVYAKDLPPGKTGATLTLANGKKINLSDVLQGNIADESGVSVSKAADGQLVYQSPENNSASGKLNTLATANGETYILTLPDKTQVWLNAASSLTYSVALNERGQRRVKLSGEAYFQVAKDKLHPFIVETANQEVEVLGTHFNIRAYNVNQTISTLEEGSVKVVSLTTNRDIRILKPQQQAINTPKDLIVQRADMESVLAWKNGLLFFNDAPLSFVLDEVSRWYDVEIEYRGVSKNKILSGGVNRSANLSAMLKILKLTGVSTKLVIEGTNRKLIVEQ